MPRPRVPVTFASSAACSETRPTGFEPTTCGLGNRDSAAITTDPGSTCDSSEGGSAAPGAALRPENAPEQPDLQALASIWSQLPEATRNAIIAISEAAQDEGQADDSSMEEGQV